MSAEFTSAELAELRVAEADVPIGFDRLLERWRSFVDEVAAGYDGSVDDYTNDVTSRDLLSQIMNQLLPPTREKAAGLVAPIDAEFMTHTVPDPTTLLGEYYRVSDGWWWRRLPTIMPTNLRATLYRPRDGFQD
jgi:hypothetical protein